MSQATLEDEEALDPIDCLEEDDDDIWHDDRSRNNNNDSWASTESPDETICLLSSHWMNVIVIKLISIKGFSEETKIMGNFYTFKHSRAINLNHDEEAP